MIVDESSARVQERRDGGEGGEWRVPDTVPARAADLALRELDESRRPSVEEEDVARRAFLARLSERRPPGGALAGLREQIRATREPGTLAGLVREVRALRGPAQPTRSEADVVLDITAEERRPERLADEQVAPRLPHVTFLPQFAGWSWSWSIVQQYAQDGGYILVTPDRPSDWTTYVNDATKHVGDRGGVSYDSVMDYYRLRMRLNSSLGYWITPPKTGRVVARVQYQAVHSDWHAALRDGYGGSNLEGKCNARFQAWLHGSGGATNTVDFAWGTCSGTPDQRVWVHRVWANSGDLVEARFESQAPITGGQPYLARFGFEQEVSMFLDDASLYMDVHNEWRIRAIDITYL